MSEAGSVDRLMSQLSLEEKAAQLCCVDGAEVLVKGKVDEAKLLALAPVGIGHMSFLGALTDSRDVLRRGVATSSDALRDLSPHRIAPLVHAEGLNGFVHPIGTQFPTPLGLASSWNPKLVEEMTKITRREMRDVGILMALSPVLDIARDPRWGRVHETYGEDPDLAAAMGVAFVRGLQGDLSDGVAATAKHFCGYGFSQAGINHAIELIGPRTMRDEFARPFEAAIRRAGLASVMNSYSEVDGIPIVANAAILTDLLRGQLGFGGIVVSDYFSAIMLHSLHQVADSPAEAGRMALTAGLDVEFPRASAFGSLVQLVREGKLSESLVDRSCRRVLELKARLGLLDAAPRRAPSFTEDDRERGRSLARSLAQQSVVLLTNTGALPIQSSVRKVAVIGELAASARIHFGAYSAPAASEFGLGKPFDMFSATANLDYIGSVLTAFREPIEDEAAQIEKETRRIDPEATSVAEELRARLPKSVAVAESLRGGPEGVSDADIAAARAVCNGAGLAVVVLGERTGWMGALATSGEGRDRRTLDIPGGQIELALAAAKSGVPTVAIVVAGRPLEVGPLVDAGVTIIYAPLLAAAAAAAIVSVLLGETVPAGRLPVSWPRSVGQVPVFARVKMGSGYVHPRLPISGHRDGPHGPQFAFGHGLSYTEFAYSNLKVTPSVAGGGKFSVTVQVANTGKYTADEVVQVYGHDQYASVTRPIQQLLAFARIPVEAGKTAQVTFEIPVDAFSFTSPMGPLIVEPGAFDIHVGGSSANLPCRALLTVTGPTVEIDPSARSLGFEVRIADA